jgi:ribokinase
MLCQNEIPPAQTSEALTVAKVHGLTTIFNPSPVPTRAAFYAMPWDKIDWLIVNQEEAYSLAHKFAEDDMNASTYAGEAKSEGEEPLDSLPRYLPKATGIVMTMGAQGVQMVLRETLAPDEAGRTAGSGKLTKLSAKAGKAHGKIINTTGAGDTFAVSSLHLSLGRMMYSDHG